MGERAGFLLQILESCKDNSCSFYSITGANNIPTLDKRAIQSIPQLRFAQDY